MERIPVEPFPPGGYIKKAMDARGWTQEDLAEVLGRNRHTVLRLLNGKTAVTPEMAHELAKAFSGTTAAFWIGLQTAYELSLANQEKRDIEQRAAIYERAPVRDIKKRVWIPDAESTDELELAVCKFLRIGDISQPSGLKVAARKTVSDQKADYESSTPPQEAWYCRARDLAQAAPATAYRSESLEDGVAELHKLTANVEDLRRVPRVLGDMGIRFVIVEPLPHAKLDGVAFWLDDNTPAIAMSLRYDRIDNFWFTLMHEIAHIRHRDTLGDPVIDEDAAGCQADSGLPFIENRANAEACESLVPKEKLDSFIVRKQGNFSRVTIMQFARLRGVHPGIVVGLLHGRKALDWKYHRAMLVKVRSEIVPSALTDGWGSTPQIH